MTETTLEQAVIMQARRLCRGYAEFPEHPACWWEDLDALWDRVNDLDKHLDEEFARSMK